MGNAAPKRGRRALLAAAIAATACRPANPPPAAPPASAPIASAASAPALPDYGALSELQQLTDQENRPFTTARLSGHVWIANFIFTTCHMACPMLSARMAVVQKRIAAESPTLQLASFSILPETDTPAVMKKYGEQFHSDPARWTFVTGKPDPVLTAVSAGLAQAAATDPHLADTKDSNFISLHGEFFVLIDGSGHIRGYYRKADAELDRMIADALRLSRALDGGKRVPA